MNKHAKIGIVTALAIAAIAALSLKPSQRQPSDRGNSACCPGTPNTALASAPTTKPLPRLLDLGAGKCVPCKMMVPILEELKRDYAGRMEVVFIDVWQDPEAGKPYNVEMIPTQIFFDAQGKELFRHTGFYSKEDILAKWKELGVEWK